VGAVVCQSMVLSVCRSVGLIILCGISDLDLAILGAYF